MTRREISRKAFDAEHKRLLLAVRHSRGPARTKALKELNAYILGTLRAKA